MGDRRQEAYVRSSIAMSYRRLNNLPLVLEQINSAISKSNYTRSLNLKIQN
jgi:hypothetical protein